VSGYVAGLIASSLFDLPTGAVIVVTLALAFAAASAFAKGEATAPRSATRSA
jgi:ABC-type Mn2+/Zn2+ transport system permease subunit